MNTWQTLRQIKYLLLARNWTGSANKVFPSGSVFVTPAIGLEMLKTVRVPAAFIWAGDAAVDPEHGQETDLIRRSVAVKMIVAVPGDAVGEKPIIGGNVPDRTKSEGRGILELEEELFAAIQKVTTDTGIVIQFRASTGTTPMRDETLGYVCSVDYAFEAYVTANRFYHPCYQLAATGGSGQATVAWSLPPDRYDRYKIVLNYVSGSTPPSSATAGTVVTLSSNLATSHTITSLAAGAYTVAVWAAYDETNATAAQADRYSSAIYKTVTVT